MSRTPHPFESLKGPDPDNLLGIDEAMRQEACARGHTTPEQFAELDPESYTQFLTKLLSPPVAIDN